MYLYYTKPDPNDSTITMVMDTRTDTRIGDVKTISDKNYVAYHPSTKSKLNTWHFHVALGWIGSKTYPRGRSFKKQEEKQLKIDYNV